MHVLFRESHGLEETAAPQDLGQAPADLVVLSFSDSDLGAFAAGWRRGREGLPGLRLANLSALTHPLSVDTYIDRTLCHAKGILIRLIGGASWWAYGVEQVARLARAHGIALAILPADGRPDPALDAASTLPVSTLRRLQGLCEAGGEIAAQGALAQLALAAGLYAGPVPGPKTLPPFGLWHPDTGLLPEAPAGDAPLIAIPFYRAWAAAADTAGIAALIRGFETAGFRALGLFVPSLKDDAAADWLRGALAVLAPTAVVNTTAFSARAKEGSPLDAAGVPVFQAIHATSTRAAWQASDRGLSPADLAMHVALPEVDGRLGAGVISFKDTAPPDPDLQFARAAHAPDAERIAATVTRVAAWHRLATLPPREKRVALVLSTYPGKAHRMAHAVGLDALASAEAMLEDLAAAGYAIAPGAPLEQALTQTILWPLPAYRAALATLPQPLRDRVLTTHGAPEDDPAVTQGAFAFAATRRGRALVVLQPERSRGPDREGEYHDTTRIPCHAYVAFYLWLRQQADALVHIGAHGTLEWLPGKSAALSGACWPEALAGPLPVLYPFIVNDPGEAAQARRRLGAVTLGHLPPPLADADLPPALHRLERLLDEYSTADGLDPARRTRLIAAIRSEAQSAGVEDDLGIPASASPAEAIPRIDRFVCDLKESQFGEGLHIWGRGTPLPFHLAPNIPGSGAAPRGPATGDPASIEAEKAALLAALAGRPVAPGPSGSPFRGRGDVLPTGRNLYGIDPRAVPSRAAHAQGVKLAEELVRRHLQDQGDYPRGLVVNLWGSATMRTAGEEFAMALHLAGLAPVWDEGSDRVTGFEVIPLALMDRPRVEVTLRVSGLFRDVFPYLAALFEAGAEALRRRDEAADMNPYTAAPEGPRVFAPAPGSYGLGLSTDNLTEEARRAAGDAWLAASSHSAAGEPARAALEARLRGAEAFIHAQDLPETDLLLAEDYAAHEAGFAAAMARLGAPVPALYHLDATRPDAPKARPLAEEIARVTRARAANPRWIAGMMRHGFRGAAEIAATLDHLAAFAHLAGVVPAHLFDLYHEATLGTPEVRTFLAEANPGALAAMEARFAALAEAGLWQSRSNSRAMGVA
ncbi:cobaltochelatase subunit CobN [Rhodobacter sp. SGA-6-6]|uniref:cobaltochelatase subunit CobN n=1 Tax=Rhodobacter sp. SGA-6-6 TaxID=2710882 RepID=UPI0013EAC3FB|nr:cobaltochelatase subunit CobN [Rhodobacter sp. SGA-6-6]NGM45924.1 cobaltochelatase subunit CobN [Rhodobacter sp. SGA-6-6]